MLLGLQQDETAITENQTPLIHYSFWATGTFTLVRNKATFLTYFEAINYALTSIAKKIYLVRIFD
jgi:hypothetical protein